MNNSWLFSFGILSLLALLGQILNQDPPGQFLVSVPQQFTDANDRKAPFFSMDFASQGTTVEVHSAAAIELEGNNIMAFWYGGTREGHKDVSIFSNVWHSEIKQWGQERQVISRDTTRESTSRYIRKLGNPVVTRGPDNAIWLFYVSVSVGGWAGSSINLTRSYNEGKTWTEPKRLITSPLLNISTLIKGTPIHYSDNSIGLPVYHEFLGKFGELVKLNSAGEVSDKIRLSWGKTSLQPIIFVTSPTTALAMMRYHGKPPNRILMQRTTDAGLSWSKVEKSQLPNPNAGIIGLTLNDSKQLLLAFNNDDEEREDMTLATSEDNGQTWQIKKTVEENRLAIADKSQQFSYPWLLQTSDGTIHLLFTWHKSHIKHMTFNTSWLNQMTTKPEVIHQ